MVVDDQFDAGVVHAQRLAERAGLSNEHAAPLAQGTVQGFDNIGLAGFIPPVSRAG